MVVIFVITFAESSSANVAFVIACCIGALAKTLGAKLAEMVAVLVCTRGGCALAYVTLVVAVSVITFADHRVAKLASVVCHRAFVAITERLFTSVALVVTIVVRAYAHSRTAVDTLMPVTLAAYAYNLCTLVTFVILVAVNAFACHTTANVARVVFICVRTFAEHLCAFVTLVVLVAVNTFSEHRTAKLAFVVVVRVLTFCKLLLALVTDMVAVIVGAHRGRIFAVRLFTAYDTGEYVARRKKHR